MADITFNVIEQQPKPTVDTYSLDPQVKNTPNKPHTEENTITPYLVRRVDSEELLPKPFKHLTCLLVITYISFVFCILTGAVANYYAWEALRFKSTNRYHDTKRFAKRAVIWSYMSFGIALAGGTIALLVNLPDILKA